MNSEGANKFGDIVGNWVKQAEETAMRAVEAEVQKLQGSGMFTEEQLEVARRHAWHGFSAPIYTDEGLCARLMIGWGMAAVAKITGYPKKFIEEECRDEELSRYKDNFGNWYCLADDIISWKEDRIKYEEVR